MWAASRSDQQERCLGVPRSQRKWERSFEIRASLFENDVIRIYWHLQMSCLATLWFDELSKHPHHRIPIGQNGLERAITISLQNDTLGICWLQQEIIFGLWVRSKMIKITASLPKNKKQSFSTCSDLTYIHQILMIYIVTNNLLALWSEKISKSLDPK